MKKLQLQTKITVGSIAGLLLALTYENSNFWFLIPVVFSIWWGVSHKRSLSDYLALSFSFSLVFWAIHIIWIISIGIDAYILLTLIMTLIFGLCGYFMFLIRNSYLPFLGYAIIFIGIETFVQYVPFGGFPWAKIAYAAVDSPFAKLAPYGSTQLVSLTIFLVSMFLIPLIGFLIQKAIFPAAVIALLMVSFVMFLNSVDFNVQKSGNSNFLIVQGSVPSSGLLFNEQKLGVLKNHVVETNRYLNENKNIESIDAIFWPENSIDVDPKFNPEARVLINSLAENLDIPLVAGAVLNENQNLKNSVIVFQGNIDQIVAEYTKIHLVPFGEYLPFRYLLEDRIARFNLLSKDFVKGKEIKNFQIGNYKIAPVICFEVAWNDKLSEQILSGGQLISVHTNNATYAFSDQIKQQFQITRFRAVESARQAIVSATTGISAHIDENGQVLWESDEFKPQSHLAQVKMINTITPAIKFKDEINIGVVFLFIGTLLHGILASRLRKS